MSYCINYVLLSESSAIKGAFPRYGNNGRFGKGVYSVEKEIVKWGKCKKELPAGNVPKKCLWREQCQNSVVERRKLTHATTNDGNWPRINFYDKVFGLITKGPSKMEQCFVIPVAMTNLQNCFGFVRVLRFKPY